jgi:hypothetical protein
MTSWIYEVGSDSFSFYGHHLTTKMLCVILTTRLSGLTFCVNFQLYAHMLSIFSLRDMVLHSGPGVNVVSPGRAAA